MVEKDKLKMLIQRRGGPCVSMYMPAHRSFPDTKQDPIRFKNLTCEAEERLKAVGLRSSDAKKLLKPAKALIKDGLFWQYQADGLAAFISSDLFYHYRLPLKFDELLVVTDLFHIKPLLPLFSHEGRFYILALSQNEVRFFHLLDQGLYALIGRESDLQGSKQLSPFGGAGNYRKPGELESGGITRAGMGDFRTSISQSTGRGRLSV